jgi:putative heme-binding domain-containing protein
LLLWWALERHADHREVILKWLSDESIWRRPLVRRHIIERLARRYAARSEPADLAAAAKLLSLAPTSDDRDGVARGLNLGLRGRKLAEPPSELASAFAKIPNTAQSSAVLELGLRIDDRDARRQAFALLSSQELDDQQRANLISVLGETSIDSALPRLLAILKSRDLPEPVRLAALAALARAGEETVSAEILTSYATLPQSLKPRAIDILVARPASGARLVEAVRSGLIPQADVSTEHLRRLAAHDSAELADAVTSLWGKVRAATPEERLAVVRRLNNDLRAAAGDPAAGKSLFTEHCATCHKLHGEGNQVGPDLTTANRGDRDYLLVSLVDPSANIRKEYLSHVAQTVDGRVLTGIVVDETDAELTLLDANNQRQRLAKADLETLEPAAISLMPEGILEKLNPGQLRDIFSYLQADDGAK